jgi:soluble lytic murein transglycosylase-like protein
MSVFRALALGVAGFLTGITTLPAAEHAILKSGFRITAEKVELRDGVYVLRMAGGGETQLDESQVERVERDDFVPPPPSPKLQAQSAEATRQVDAKPKLTIQELVTRAAVNNGLPPEFVHSVARAESAYQANAVSHKGAIGVMQLMPGTAAALQADPHDPEQNIEAGARYLRELLLRYDGDSVKALAAYNAGPGAVDRYNGPPPYRETITYVDRVLRNYSKLKETSQTAPAGQIR